ncbi:hypothetical protein G6O67_001411 [Ophiocordyceps sinensis]|uniref:Uncharacterized protein n=1 Tax=Ophiocordyceps sinensis TaxID=72228 RepID=A0A8H4PXA1_9HYPO|nr:hypothetical protein G6O67_001411 [Ophiocordyceps sinensis]
MDDAAEWNALPADEQRSVWHETEHNFWQSFELEHDALRIAAEADYSKATLDVKVELGTLSGKRTQLDELRGRLSRELASVEEELARIAEACDDKATRLVALEQDYRKSEQERLESRERVVKTMEDFFRFKRGHGHSPELKPSREQHMVRDALAMRAAPQPPPTDERPIRHALPIKGSRPPTTPSTPIVVLPRPDMGQGQNHAADVLVDVVDADGCVIGPVRRIEPWNQWVKEIQDMPIKRAVKIRRGRKFNQDHLATIYDRSEGKGVKFVSSMIQATGEIQAQRCHSCDKNQGAFDDCIILGGPLFQKCGNCEWNRQGCHMPLVTKSNNAGTPVKGRPPKKHLELNAPPARLHPDPEGAANEGVVRTADIAKAAMDSVRAPREMDVVELAPPAHKSPGGQEPVQMPTPREPKEQSFAGSAYTAAPAFASVNAMAPFSGFTPANARSRPPSRDIPTPSGGSSPRPMASLEPLEDITRDNLVLRHNGVVYTYPEIVEGVPVAKIDPGHPYWDLGWPCIKSLVEPQLESWREKNSAALQATARGEGGSAKFQTGRQVNRGVRILEFLETGEISPYQLLSKKFTHTGKGAITSYDTLFRLCESLSELARYNLSVTPIEWLRHRLHEMMLEKGINFNVSKTIHDFYHDPKLSALRAKNGYKSIGRPSGYKTTVQSNGTPQGSSKKRKDTHSQASSPRETPSAVPSPLAARDGELSPTPGRRSLEETDSSSDTRLHKRPKHLSPAPVVAREDSARSEYSETDSWSGAPLTKEDWRLYQVKTRLFTSSTAVTQYWNWQENEQLFEHQVLKDTNPVTWGVHREPIDFTVRLDDIVEVRWNVDALQVHLVMRKHGATKAKQDSLPRGDVMAAFKRERTIRRFLEFCRDRNLRTVDVTADEMDIRWGEMQSERLPDTDEQASESLKE